MSLISVANLDVKYGDLQVLWDVSLTVEEEDSIVAIVGPNGAGKTTLLKTLSGIVAPSAGTIEILGENLENVSSTDIVKLGFVHISEERNLFGDMSVYTNLKMGAYTHREDFEDRLQDIYDLFPVLEERKKQEASTLSGGEQQMLAIGRGLMAEPDVLALDEPSGALAPQLTQRVFDKIDAISEETNVILVEQHVDEALKLADRGYLLENGEIAASGPGDELLKNERVKRAYLRG